MTPDLDDASALIEEEQIEPEPHAERVDAAAAWDQQPGSCALAREQRESQQPADDGGRDRKLEAQDLRPLEPVESDRCPHRESRTLAADLSPTISGR